jgi:hypothetical protein
MTNILSIVLNTSELIKYWGKNMYAKRCIVYILVLLIVLSLAAQLTIGITTATPPGVRPDAITKLKLDEDSAPYYLDLYDIYEISDAPLNFTVWDGSTWGSSYQSANLTASINTNDTIIITPKPNMFGTDIIKLNATNLKELSTHFNLTVSITSINDPPVIEMIGNVKVNNTDFVKFFLYEDEWFNETVTALDNDGDTLVFFDNASEFDIDYLTGEISFLPTDKNIGIMYANITVSDVNGTNSQDTILIQFTILNVNDPPIAKIIMPENNSYYYYYDYIYFEGSGTDPDIEHGDFLYYEWYSDIDGYLGEGEILEWVYLSKGTHIITLNVTDAKGFYDTDTVTIYYEGDPYQEYHYFFLSLFNNTLLIKQNEQATCSVEVDNWGFSEDTAIFEFKTYFDFPGEIEFEVDNITLDAYDTKIVNLTVSIPANAEIGFYPVDLYAKPDVDYDDYYNKYMWEDFGMDTLNIFVISNQTYDSTIQALQPEWNVGDNWVYTLDEGDEYTSIKGTLTMEVSEETHVIVDNTRYDAYLFELDSDLEIDYEYDFESSNVEVKMTGDSYYRKSDLAVIQNSMSTEMSMDYYGDTTVYRSNMNNTYDPPALEYKFPLKSGTMWTVNTKQTTVTITQYDDEYDDYTERDKEVTEETSSKMCLGTKTVTTDAGTFEAYLIAEYYSESEHIYYDYDNDHPDKPEEGATGKRSRQGVVDIFNSDDISIEYYSPDVNYTVKGVQYSQVYNYDYYDYNWTEIYDWEETVIVELSSYELVIPVEEPDEPEPNDNITDPGDLDEDGLPDDWEEMYDMDDPDSDSDGDGYTNLEEFENGTNPRRKDDSPEDPIDSDEDGLPDAWEYYYDLDPLDPTDAYYDSDNDGVNNLKEYLGKTSPTDPDDHPEIIEETDEPSESDSIFGLGKVGDLDLFYIYLLILIIIIILVVLAGVVKYRKRKRDHTRRMPEQRIAEEPVKPVVQDQAPGQRVLKQDASSAVPPPRPRIVQPTLPPPPPSEPLPPPPPDYEQYGYPPYQQGYNQPYQYQYQDQYYNDNYRPQYQYRNRRPPTTY